MNQSEHFLQNESANYTNGMDAGANIMWHPWVQSMCILLYSLIFLLGVSGNSLVVYVVLRNRAMQTITNIFITNLAISDILMCLLAVPFTPIGFYLTSWVFGETLCHLVPMTLGLSVYVSTLTSTAIAIDRFFVIVHPFRPRMKKVTCLMLLVAIWIISISISLPLGIYQKVKWNENEEIYTCTENWPRKQSRQFFTLTSLVLQYIVPCCIIAYCYTKVSNVLKKRAKVKMSMGSKSREKDELEIKRKKRTNNMLIAMVSIFVCCWLPLNIWHLFTEYQPYLQRWEYFVLIFFIAHIVAMSSTMYNPFLYAWMNDNFRKEFKTVMPCLFRSTHEANSNGNFTQYTNIVESHPPSHCNPQNCERNGNETEAPGNAYFDPNTEKVCLNIEEEDEAA